MSTLPTVSGTAIALTSLGYAIAIGWSVFAAKSIERVTNSQIGGDPAVAIDLVRCISAGDMRAEIDTTIGDSTSFFVHLRTMQSHLNAAWAINSRSPLRQRWQHASARVAPVATSARKVPVGSAGA
jgi:hypothetical protein